MSASTSKISRGLVESNDTWKILIITREGVRVAPTINYEEGNLRYSFSDHATSAKHRQRQRRIRVFKILSFRRGKCRNPLKIIGNAEIHSNSQNYILAIQAAAPPYSKNTIDLARDEIHSKWTPYLTRLHLHAQAVSNHLPTYS